MTTSNSVTKVQMALVTGLYSLDKATTIPTSIRRVEKRFRLNCGTTYAKAGRCLVRHATPQLLKLVLTNRLTLEESVDLLRKQSGPLTEPRLAYDDVRVLIKDLCFSGKVSNDTLPSKQPSPMRSSTQPAVPDVDWEYVGAGWKPTEVPLRSLPSQKVGNPIQGSKTSPGTCHVIMEDTHRNRTLCKQQGWEYCSMLHVTVDNPLQEAG